MLIGVLCVAACVQVTAADLSDGEIKLSDYIDEGVLKELLATEDKRSKSSKLKNSIVRTHFNLMLCFHGSCAVGVAW